MKDAQARNKGTKDICESAGSLSSLTRINENLGPNSIKRERVSSPHGAPLGAALLSDAAWAEIALSLKLSGRELEITRGVFDNLTEGAIASNLGISENTIHTHLHRLFTKLRVTTRVQMVLRVMEALLKRAA